MYCMLIVDDEDQERLESNLFLKKAGIDSI